MLAIAARSGKFLPVCLTFGPVNGPDDFCYVVDRAFGPGRGRKNRYTREWVAYVDDLTIRTGRVVDGSFRTDAEHEEEVRRAMRDAPVTVGQPARDALEALGVQAEALGTKGKHDPKVSDHNHPSHHQRPKGWFRPRVRDLLGVWSRRVPWFWVGFWGRAPFGSGRCASFGASSVRTSSAPQLFGSRVDAWGLLLGECYRARGAREPVLANSRPALASVGRVCGSRPGRGSMEQRCSGQTRTRQLKHTWRAIWD